MEVEIRQYEIGNVSECRELPSTVGKLDLDGAGLGTIHLIGAHGLEKIACLCNALLQFIERRFRVLMLRNVDSREARGGTLGRIAGDLHLTNQRMHVRIQTQL